jgi:uncharacterized cupredoxin-like copper-binding protein
MKLTRTTLMATVLAVALLGAAAAGVVAHASGSSKTIAVTEKEFKITLSPKKATPGSVVFSVRNVGKYTHALAIAGPGVSTKKTAMIKPGKTATLKVSLKAGTYTLWCPVPGHAAKGMKTTLIVAGAAGGPTPPVTTTDTGSSGGGGGGGGDAWS